MTTNRVPDTGYDHYVVVTGLIETQNKVILMDPAQGPVEVELDEFLSGRDKMSRAVLLVGRAADN